MTTKNYLRKEYTRLRKALPPREFRKHNLALQEQFFNYFNLNDVHAIHFFLPIEDNREVDTWGIMKGVKQQYPEISIVIARADPVNMEMEHYEFGSNTQLEINKWGIPEPVNGKPFPVASLDMVLIPLLIFDKHGDRVGYGKGFYDRFLKDCSSKTQKIGLSLFPPVEKIHDTGEYDIKLNYCVTPDMVWKF